MFLFMTKHYLRNTNSGQQFTTLIFNRTLDAYLDFILNWIFSGFLVFWSASLWKNEKEFICYNEAKEALWRANAAKHTHSHTLFAVMRTWTIFSKQLCAAHSAMQKMVTTTRCCVQKFSEWSELFPHRSLQIGCKTKINTFSRSFFFNINFFPFSGGKQTEFLFDIWEKLRNF